MFRFTNLSVVALVFCLAAGIALNNVLRAEDKTQDNKLKSMTGTILCLLPTDDKKGANTVVSSSPCDGYDPHAHLFIDSADGNIYPIIASAEKIKEIEQSSNKSNFKLFGKIEGSERGLVLYIK